MTDNLTRTKNKVCVVDSRHNVKRTALINIIEMQFGEHGKYIHTKADKSRNAKQEQEILLQRVNKTLKEKKTIAILSKKQLS